MKRRDALKGLGLSFGYIIATPTVISMLQGCKTEVNLWKPLFFDVDEGTVIRNLIDLILPKTEATPGAIDVNVPEFIDLYASKVYSKEQQNKFKNTTQEIINELLGSKRKVSKITLIDYDTLLTKYLKADKETQDSFKNSEKENTVLEALMNLRNSSVWAYKTSELIGETVLAYAPIPGKHKGCVSLEEATKGKAWSL